MGNISVPFTDNHSDNKNKIRIKVDTITRIAPI